MAAAPVATLSAPHADRPPCVYRGFCNYGCSTNAKSSILVTYIPRAIRAGAEIRPNAMVARIEHDASGRVTGVLHFRNGPATVRGGSALFRQRAKAVILAGYAIESPRLLLNSASSLFPDGLANSSGMVGRCFMIHAGHQMFAKFPQRIGQYKAPPGLAITEHFNRTLPDADFACGYSIEVVGPHVVDFAARISAARSLWGAALRRTMFDYNYYSGVGIVGETLPQFDNRVKLHDTERDRYGLPVAHVLFSHHENDRRLIRAFDRQDERDPASRRRRGRVGRQPHGAPDGHLPHGPRSPHVSGQRRWSSARRAQSLHLRRLGLSDIGRRKPVADHPGHRGANRGSYSQPWRPRASCEPSHPVNRRINTVGGGPMAEVVVITGASAGVGRATVRAFAQARGIHRSDRPRHRRTSGRGAGGRSGRRTGAGIADRCRRCRGGRERRRSRSKVQLGPIDIWINVAMATIYAPLHRISAAEYRRATEVTYLGNVYGTMAALKRMRARNRGTIVQVGSALAYRAIPLQSPYCGAKFAIRGFTDSLRSELLHDRLRYSPDDGADAGAQHASIRLGAE